MVDKTQTSCNSHLIGRVGVKHKDQAAWVAVDIQIAQKDSIHTQPSAAIQQPTQKTVIHLLIYWVNNSIYKQI